jgi:WD40 repeat protein
MATNPITHRPNPTELEFLNESYNAFLDIYDEIKSDSFWNKDAYYRLSKTRDTILIYSEILEYEPMGWFLEALKKMRPPMEAELSKEYLLFVRNVLVHFPFFKSWDEIKFTKAMVNWSKPGQSIDRFLSRFSGHEDVKYRIWNPKSKAMIYVSIGFPKAYVEDSEIQLKDFMPEKEGSLFIMSLMHRVLMSQVESMKEMSEEHIINHF